MTSLDMLTPGQKARVAEVGGEDRVAQRLLEMGLVEGTLVEFLRVAPLGDPIEFRLDDRYNLSLRRAEARLVTVVPE